MGSWSTVHAASSEPSAQCTVLSHSCAALMHCPFAHWKPEQPIEPVDVLVLVEVTVAVLVVVVSSVVTFELPPFDGSPPSPPPPFDELPPVPLPPDWPWG